MQSLHSAEASTGHGVRMIPRDQLRAYCQSIVGSTVRQVLAERQTAPAPAPVLPPLKLGACLQKGVCPSCLEEMDCAPLTAAVRFEARRQRKWEDVMRVLGSHCPGFLEECQRVIAKHAFSLNRMSQFTGHGTVVRCAARKAEGAYELSREGLTEVLCGLGAKHSDSHDGRHYLLWECLPFELDADNILIEAGLESVLALLEHKYRIKLRLVSLTPEDRGRLLFLRGLVEVTKFIGDFKFSVLTSIEGGEFNSAQARSLREIVEFMRKWQPREEVGLDDGLLFLDLYRECETDWVCLGVDKEPEPTSPTVEDYVPDEEVVAVPDEVPALEIGVSVLAVSDGELSRSAIQLPQLVDDDEDPLIDVSPASATKSPFDMSDLPIEVVEDIELSVTEFLEDVESYRMPYESGRVVLALPSTAPHVPAPVCFADVARGAALPGQVACLDASGLSPGDIEVCRAAIAEEDLDGPLRGLGIDPGTASSLGPRIRPPLYSPVPAQALDGAIRAIVEGVLTHHGFGTSAGSHVRWFGRAPKAKTSWYRTNLAGNDIRFSSMPAVTRFVQQGRMMCAPVCLCDGDCPECPWGREKLPRRTTRVYQYGDDEKWGVPDRWGATSGWTRVPLHVHHRGFTAGLPPLLITEKANVARWEAGWAPLDPGWVVAGYDGLSTFHEVFQSGVFRPRLLLLYVDPEDANGGSDLTTYFTRDSMVDLGAQIFGCDDD